MDEPMIIKVMFGQREHGSEDRPVSYFYDRVANVEHVSPENWDVRRDEYHKRIGGWSQPRVSNVDWEELGHLDSVYEFVCILRHDDQQVTMIEVRDPSLFGVWLMSDLGETIDTLYRGW